MLVNCASGVLTRTESDVILQIARPFRRGYFPLGEPESADATRASMRRAMGAL